MCVATIKALKYHGGAELEKIKDKNLDALSNGMENLFKHINNIKNKFGLNIIVAINKYKDDLEEEINYLKSELKKNDVQLSLVEAWEKGGEGAIDLAENVIKLCDKEANMKFVYELNDNIQTKIEKVSKNIYGASGVEFSDESLNNIKYIEELGYEKLPICIAKTQYSFSDDPKNLECKEPFKIHIQDVVLKSGAGFIVVLAGKIFTMPGLPRVPAAENIDIDDKENIVGIF